MGDQPPRRRMGALRVAALLIAALSAGCGAAARGTVVLDAPSAASTLPGSETAGGLRPDQLTGATDADLRGIGAAPETLTVVGVDDDGPAVWTAGPGGDLRRSMLDGVGVVDTLDAVALNDGSGIAFGGDGTGASWMWRTDDGASWEQVSPLESGIDGRVAAVTSDGLRWLAVGDRVDPEGGEAYEGIVWSSEDGRTFQPAMSPLELDEGTLTDVVVADGTLIVVGFDVDGGRVWTSVPGEDIAPAEGPFDAATIEGVTATTDGFLALGRSIADLQARTWTSSDGLTWHETNADGSALATTDEIGDLATLGGTPVAVGSAGAVWWLDDATWRRRERTTTTGG